LRKINKQLVDGGEAAGKLSNWTLGLERTIIVGLNMYNGKTDTTTKNTPNTRFNWHYGFDVLDKVYQYPPTK